MAMAIEMHGKQCGFSLLELMLVVSLLSLLGAVTVPQIQQSFNTLMLRRLHGILLMQISETREQAIAQQRTSHIHFENNQWCAWFEGDHKSDCALAKGTLRQGFTFRATQYNPRIFSFSAGRGFSSVNGGTLRLRAGRQDQEISIVVSALGRIRGCSSPAMSGIPACV
ncbi:hypothetical protein CWE12_08025 [Aliidiomarina sedimenti]|uniref:Type II secretion system protein H n=1 Tax=Aliidiomarina sedimenti TaxID=1933879 RepID=A0ABY0BZG7_9GAMM|nr:GspH/FimT family pseudopilin [Aliidiomarina sedimenti]RUO29906.1 hypothetical protein CWE12_08025 [Aliidiomarina sedimenti]